MPTQDLTVGGAGSGIPASFSAPFVIDKHIEFANDGTFPAADVLQLLDVKAGWYVAMVGVQVHTAEGAAATGDVGDATDPNGYIDAVDMNAVGFTASGPVALTEGAPNTVTGYSNGKLYTAADTIDLTLDDTVDAAVITVFAVVFPLVNDLT